MKTYGILIKRRDLTVPQTKEEEKKSHGNPRYRIPKTFICRVNAEIPPSHKLCEGGRICYF